MGNGRFYDSFSLDSSCNGGWDCCCWELEDPPEGAVSAHQSSRRSTKTPAAQKQNGMGMIKLSHPYRLSGPLLHGCSVLSMRSFHG